MTSQAEAAQDRARPVSSLKQALIALGQGVARATIGNPLLVKEFRSRMRGTRAYWILLLYTLLLAFVIAVMYFGYDQSVASQPLQPGMGAATGGAPELGRSIYSFIFVTQAIMIMLIAPAITAGTITIEREQRSYDLLVATPLRASDLIRGKLWAAVSFIALLLTASLPLVSICFLVGGVSPGEIFFSYLIAVLSAAVYGANGVFWSATFRTTAAATVVAYLIALLAGLLTSILGLTVGMASGKPDPSFPLQSLSPVAAAWRAVQPEYFFHSQLPGWVSGATLNLLVATLLALAAMGRLEHFEPPRAFWTRIVSTLLWCFIGLFVFGAWYGGVSRTQWNTPTAVAESVGGGLLVTLVYTCLVTPVLNTGDLLVRRGESALKRYFAGFLPFRAFGADLSCGLPLTLGWGLFLCLIIPFAVWDAGKTKLFPTEMWASGTILIAATVTGLAGIGNLLSVLLPSRWAACVLTYLSAVVMMALPYMVVPWWSQRGSPHTVSLAWQVLYLAPTHGINQLMTPATFLREYPPLLFSPAIPVWVVTSAIYLGIAAVCFFASTMGIHRIGSGLQKRMDREDAA